MVRQRSTQVVVTPDLNRVVRYKIDAVGNDLSAVLRWCETHNEAVWVYDDGSFRCPHDVTVGWSPDEHDVVDAPWEAGQTSTDKEDAVVSIPQQVVLDCPMDPTTNDARSASVRDYLVALLAKLWREKEGFDGKRPFGNSGWVYEVYSALVSAGLLDGKFDESGYLDEVDTEDADALVLAAIGALGQSQPSQETR